MPGWRIGTWLNSEVIGELCSFAGSVQAVLTGMLSRLEDSSGSPYWPDCQRGARASDIFSLGKWALGLGQRGSGFSSSRDIVTWHPQLSQRADTSVPSWLCALVMCSALPCPAGYSLLCEPFVFIPREKPLLHRCPATQREDSWLQILSYRLGRERPQVRALGTNSPWS